jgi:uncharacterized repeat protein (TIGR01451 family)
MVKDINLGQGHSSPAFMTDVNGTLFFYADDGSHGKELWTSDGTLTGTVMVKDIWPGSESSFSIQSGINVNGLYLFSATDGSTGFELWESDGTLTGTVMVKDINPGDSSAPGGLTNVNGTLFFGADDGSNGYELWKSDGTLTGTVMVKDINPGNSSSSLSDLANVGDILFFRANDGSHGMELWKSDGTLTGTTMIKDIWPGGSSFPINLINVDGTLFFSAADNSHGRELWALAAADFTSIKTVTPSEATPGQLITYTLHITNTGIVDLHATITDTLPLSVTLRETCGTTLTLPSGMLGITWTATVTAPSGAWVETVVVIVDEGSMGPLTNLMEVITKEGVTGSARVTANPYKVYLPVVVRH